MYPPNYQSDYFLYIAVADMTISMVLFQVENGIEHPIYYLSQNLNDTEVKYSYIENIDFEIVQAVQIFHHYILFRKTIVILDCNPMNHILSHKFLGRKYTNCQRQCIMLSLWDHFRNGALTS